jgi:hypothetical protein
VFNVDFENTKTINSDTVNPDTVNIEVFSQIDIMLKSGLHPSFLTFEEKDFLKEYVGVHWYQNYGWLENDLHRINL